MVEDKVVTLAGRIRKEGEKRGILIGEQNGRIEVARRMLAADQPFEDITKYSRLSPEQVQKLRVQAETQALPRNP